MKAFLFPANLKNSFFLFFRLLRSGNKIAIYQLLLYGFSVLLFPVDLFLSMILCCHKSKSATESPILFLSGYSRSGTTMIYQALSACLIDAEYINNLVIIFPRSYPLVLFWYRKLSKKRDLGLYNFYGRTIGLYGTNDGAQLMQSFFEEGELDRKSISNPDRIKLFFARYSKLIKKPLIFKNCNLYLKYPELKSLFPKALFIYVKRDPASTCRSTLKAREFIQGTMDSDWEYSVFRKNKCCQDPITEILKNIKHAYGLIDSMLDDDVMIINYEDFCDDPCRFILDISKTINSRVCMKSLHEIKKFITPLKPFAGSGKFEKRILDTKEKLFAENATV